MSDDGYTWRDHAMCAYECMAMVIGGNNESGEINRGELFRARASLTRAIALLPAPKDDDAA